MLDFLRHRAQQVKERRSALIDQETQQAALKERVQGLVRMLKDLLKDARYEAYTTLLKDTQRSLLAEREALLQSETERDARDFQAAILTGRLMQLDYILSTPDHFLTLADEGLSNGTAARSLVREPVGTPRTRSV